MLRRLLAEWLGSLLLTAAVVGSGIMGQRLAAGNAALALLANTATTVGILATLIALLQPISGAHFNPAVSLTMALVRKMSWQTAFAYISVQLIGCCIGVVLAHTMFELPVVQISAHTRNGAAQWLAELVATCGLLLVVLGHQRKQDGPWMIAAWIGAAYWFTASTSFANPAITIARAMTDTFSGIRPLDAPAFVAAQLVGASLAALLWAVLFARSSIESATSDAAVVDDSSRDDAPGDNAVNANA